MAPALKQDTQHPELFLSYLSTPPYTPSPPTPVFSSGGGVGTHALSGNNMEHGPSGLTNHHIDNSSLSQPTPPHSTDSSAPLSPVDKHLHEPLRNSADFRSGEKHFGEAGGGSLPPAPMGCCSVVEDQSVSRGNVCPAPQPVDTPPPPLLQSYTNSPQTKNTPFLSSTTSTGLEGFNGSGGELLPQALADEVLNIMSMNPSLLEHFNNSVSNAPVTPQYLSLPEQAESLCSSLSVRQLRLQKRGVQLLRRIRRVTGRALGCSVSSQLQSLLLSYQDGASPEQGVSPMELTSVGGEMQAATQAYAHHDSDATESSSGEESCDEMETGYKGHSADTPIRQRALYKYMSERSFVASRSYWLEAQLADIECKIHQHNRAYAKLRQWKRSSQPSPLILDQNNHKSEPQSCVPSKNIGNSLPSYPITSTTQFPHPKYSSHLINNSSQPPLSFSHPPSIQPPAQETPQQKFTDSSQTTFNGSCDSAYNGNSQNSFPSPSFNNSGPSPSFNNFSQNSKLLQPPLNGSSQLSFDALPQGTLNNSLPFSDSEFNFTIHQTPLKSSSQPPFNSSSSSNDPDPPPNTSSDFNKPSFSSFIPSERSSISSTSSDSCARALGYRWHRKRRWLRVGNVFSGVNSVNNAVPQPTFVLPCGCQPPLTCILCNKLTVKKTEKGTNGRIASKDVRYKAKLSPTSLKPGFIPGLCSTSWYPKVSTSSRAGLKIHKMSGEKSENYSVCHPVLSHSSDLPESMRLSNLIKSKAWLRKVNGVYYKPVAAVTTPPKKTHGKKKKKSKDKTKHKKKSKKKQKSESSGKLKLRLSKSSVTGELIAMSPYQENTFQEPPIGKKGRESRPNSPGYNSLDQLAHKTRRASHNSSLNSTNCQSPSPIVQRTKQSNVMSYDLDNVIINQLPNNKVEKMDYKEIITPAWTEIEESPVFNINCTEVEDVSLEAIISRHLKGLKDERIRFASNSQVGGARGGTSRQRGGAMVGASSNVSSRGSNSPDNYSTLLANTTSMYTPVEDEMERVRPRTVSCSVLEDIQPYTKRIFPLTQSQFSQMEQENKRKGVVEERRRAVSCEGGVKYSVRRDSRQDSEGRSSPHSESTDSAQEEETSRREEFDTQPDWTIQATTDMTGHCLMQVMRH